MKYGKRKLWKALIRLVLKKKTSGIPAGRYNERIELTNEMVFKKVDQLVREKRLYRDSNLTMNDIADMLGTNRTYISRAMQSYSDGFVNYMTRLRVEYLHSYIIEADEEGRLLEDGEDLAMKTGFVNKRAMQRAIKKIEGKSLYEFKKDLSESKK